jgi:hypothetical protein
MSVINHNSIIATTLDKKEFERVAKWIENNFSPEVIDLFAFKSSLVNGYQTIVMVPDGSNEGWEESNLADEARNEFIAELEKANFSDGSSPWSYVEVGFGEYGQKVLRGNNHNCYSDAPYEGDADE